MEPASRSTGTGFVATIVLLACTVLGGCSSFKPYWAHRFQVEEHSQVLLSTRTTVGAEWLEVESNLDATIRQFVASEGRPDYVYVVDAEKLHLYYLDEDLSATFERAVFRSTSEVERQSPVPKKLMRLLPHQAKRRIANVRAVRRR